MKARSNCGRGGYSVRLGSQERPLRRWDWSKERAEGDEGIKHVDF